MRNQAVVFKETRRFPTEPIDPAVRRELLGLKASLLGNVPDGVYRGSSLEGIYRGTGEFLEGLGRASSAADRGGNLPDPNIINYPWGAPIGLQETRIMLTVSPDEAAELERLMVEAGFDKHNCWNTLVASRPVSSKAGMVPCLRCEEDFLSEDKTLFRTCPGCKGKPPSMPATGVQTPRW